MSILTYSDLRTSVADWAARPDIGSVIPDFIALAESMFNNGDGTQDIDPLRCRDMETGPTTLALAANLAALPTNFLEMIRLTTGSSAGPAGYVTPDYYTARYPGDDDGGAGVLYTIIGTNIRIGAAPTITYYAKITALSDANPTNWLLTKSPNSYLFGALFYFAIYNKNADQAMGYRQLMSAALAGVRGADRWSVAGAFVQRSGSPTP